VVGVFWSFLTSTLDHPFIKDRDALRGLVELAITPTPVLVGKD
jgi:hypothetical protein